MARKKIYSPAKTIRPGKVKHFRKWKKEIGEFSDKTIRYTLEVVKLPILFDSGSKLKVRIQTYFKI